MRTPLLRPEVDGATERYADTATGAFGGAPYGLTKRCTGLGKRMRTPPLGPSVGPLWGPRNVVISMRNACEP
eukprot:8774215-Pyramimonas_sp.AAC.1